MKKGEGDKIRLEHILSSINFILNQTKDKTEDDFYREELLKYAVQKHLEIIGEAANFISDEIKDKNEDLEWKGIIGARNIYIHAYFNIDWVTVWEIVTTKLKPLRIKIESIIAELKH